jgi:hypothetical protein
MGVKLVLCQRVEHRLSVFEKRLLRRILRTKRVEAAERWRKSDSEELHNLYSSANIRVVKSRGMKWAGHTHGKYEKCIKKFGRKTCRDNSKALGMDGKDNNKLDVKEMG